MIFSVVLVVLCLVGGLESVQVPAMSSGLPNSSAPADVLVDLPTVEMLKSLEVRRYWKTADKQLRSLAARFLKTAMPSMMREIYTRNISMSCLNGLLQVSKGLRNTRLWAFKMLDSSGRLPVGFLSGTVSALGNYDECVSINVTEKGAKLQGQYCMIDITPPTPEWRNFQSIHFPVPELINVSQPDSVISFLTGFVHMLHTLTIRNGICVPSTCSVDDVHKLVQIIPEKVGMNEWKFSVERCEVREITKFTPLQIFVLCVFGVAILLQLIGTVVDQSFEERTNGERSTRETALRLLRCFSLFRNGRKISNYLPPCEEFRPMHGMLFVCIYWIMGAHSIVYANLDMLANFSNVLSLSKMISFEVMYNKITPMQTILFILAFTTTYKFMKLPEKNLCIWKHLLKAYWRYTPIYMLSIVMILAAPILGSGPAWLDDVNPTYETCKSEWWQNLLYMNNYVDPDKSCLDHSWLFAVAAQLHIMGIVILIPLKIRPNIALMLNFLIATGSLVTVALTNTYYNLPPTELIAFLDVRDRSIYAERSYRRVYTHVCVYCAGIFVGYFMAKKPKLKISPVISSILWVICIAGGAALLCSVHEFHIGVAPPALVSACYAAFTKLALALILSWITISCTVNPSGVVCRVLSWRPFSFFSRLTVIAYVIHPVLIQMIMSFRKTHLFASVFEILFNILGMTACTFIISYAMHLILEAPVCQLTNFLRKSCGKTTFDHLPPSGDLSEISIKAADVPEKAIKPLKEKSPDDSKLQMNTSEKTKY